MRGRYIKGLAMPEAGTQTSLAHTGSGGSRCHATGQAAAEMDADQPLVPGFQWKDQAEGERRSGGARDTDSSEVQVASQSFLGESDAVLQPVADQGGDGL